jgi:hypothetical protein
VYLDQYFWLRKMLPKPEAPSNHFSPRFNAVNPFHSRKRPSRSSMYYVAELSLLRSFSSHIGADQHSRALILCASLARERSVKRLFMSTRTTSYSDLHLPGPTRFRRSLKSITSMTLSVEHSPLTNLGKWVRVRINTRDAVFQLIDHRTHRCPTSFTLRSLATVTPENDSVNVLVWYPFSVELVTRIFSHKKFHRITEVYLVPAGSTTRIDSELYRSGGVYYTRRPNPSMIPVFSVDPTHFALGVLQNPLSLCPRSKQRVHFTTSRRDCPRVRASNRKCYSRRSSINSTISFELPAPFPLQLFPSFWSN